MLIKTLSPEIKDSTALFLFVRFVEFINQRWRDGNLKTNKRNKLLRPVICCLGQLILDYSNFKSFSSRFRVRLRRESRYLAVEIRWMVGAGKDEEDTKIFQKTNFQITQRNRETRISHLIIWFFLQPRTSREKISSGARVDRTRVNRHDRR